MNGLQIERLAGETLLVLEPTLDAAGAGNLYRQLTEVFADVGKLVLDAGRVQRVDTAGLQLLAAFCHARRRAGLPLQWRSTSPALCEAASLLGFNETLGQLT